VPSAQTEDEAHAPLIVDPDAVLPTAVALEGFELVVRRNPQARQFGGRVQLEQLVPRHPLDVLYPPEDRNAMDEQKRPWKDPRA
jgi:hypothetical protein